VVSADINRLAIGGSKDNFDHEVDVWKKVYDDILMYSFNDEVQVVVADNTSISNKSRLQYAKFKDLYELELLLFRVSAEECIRRNAEREKPVPEDAMKRMINYWQEPSEEVKNIFTIKEIN
jgi:tRNA uridine 5-carbamoylmethylation protein Kti12